MASPGVSERREAAPLGDAPCREQRRAATGGGRIAADGAGPPTDEEILSAVFDAFAEHGFEATSVREIARDLGLSHNTLPQRFGTKERLWQAAVDHVLGGQVARLIEALQEAPSDGLERLRSMMVAFIRLSAERPQALQLLNKESASPGPRLDHLAARYIDPSTALARTLLSDLHRAGRIRTDDLALVYFAMVHAASSPMVHSSLFRHLGGEVDLDDPAAVDAWADHAIEVLIHGLAIHG